MYKCFVCEKEVKDNEEFEWFGLDGDKIHKKCKPNVEKKIEIIDNMPEGLQSSYRGMCSEDAIDSMEEASDKLDEVIELLGNIV